MELPKQGYTMDNAMNKIIELNEEYKFDYIGLDRGYGDTQLELLHKYGNEHPETGLAQKCIGYQFSEKIMVRDPYTQKKDKKDIKPFMVNNSVNMFEKKKIVLDPKDSKMIQQLEEYRVKSISSTGRIIYTDENEHAIDAMNLALLVFEQHYGDLMKEVFSSRIQLVGNIDKRQTDIKGRSFIGEDIDADALPVGILASHYSNTHGVVGIIDIKKNVQKSSRKTAYARRKF